MYLWKPPLLMTNPWAGLVCNLNIYRIFPSLGRILQIIDLNAQRHLKVIYSYCLDQSSGAELLTQRSLAETGTNLSNNIFCFSRTFLPRALNSDEVSRKRPNPELCPWIWLRQGFLHSRLNLSSVESLVHNDSVTMVYHYRALSSCMQHEYLRQHS